MEMQKISLLNGQFNYVDDYLKVPKLKNFYVINIKDLTIDKLSNAMQLLEENMLNSNMKLYVKNIDFKKLIGDIIYPLEVTIEKKEEATIYGIPIIREIYFLNELLGEGDCFLIGEK